MSSLRSVVALNLIAVAMGAQTPGHVVTGVAFDSIAGVALSGAVIQAVRVDSMKDAGQKSFTAIADASGHYRLTGLPDGRFAIGFQHQALNAFGLESPIGGLELAGDTTVTFNLAMTAESVLGALPCKDPKGAPEAVLGGFVTDARRNAPAAGADVVATWEELGLDHGKLRSQARRITATVAEDGTYKLCGVPPSAAIGLKVSRAGFVSIESEILISDQGVARRDFNLADSGAVRGTAILVGRILEDDGTPVGSGVVAIAALKVEVPISNGTFTVNELPAGTWSIGVRAIGFEERTEMVDVVDRATKTMTITMGKKVQTLETVNVVGKAGRDIRTLSEIQERQRLGGGTAFLPGNEYLAHANVVTDVMRAARGFSQKNEWKVEATGGYSSGGRMISCTTIPSDSVLFSVKGKSAISAKAISVYLDGMRYPGGMQMLINDVKVDQVLAVETYADVTRAPVQYRTNDACAVIVVWTKH